MKKIYAIVILLTLGITQTQIYAQCFNCDINSKAFSIGEGIASGTNSFAGGSQTTASENNSFVFGENSYVFQPGSIALGNFSTINSANSYVFGQYLNSSVNNSITIGLGTSSASLLSNSKPSSIMFGVTHKPSLTIVAPTGGSDVGYLGIGTEEPKEKLHLNEGNLLITGVNSGTENYLGGALLFSNVTDDFNINKWSIEYLTPNPFQGVTGLNFRKYTNKIPGTPQLVSALFLADNGNIGVGNKGPQAKLDVSGSFKAQDAAIANTLTTNNLSLTGYLGLGTNLPKQKLHIENGNILVKRTVPKISNTPNGSIIFDANEYAHGAFIKWGIEYVNSANDGYGLNFWRCDSAAGDPRRETYYPILFLDDNGYVGINKKNPTETLDVNGSLKTTRATITGNLTANSATITTLSIDNLTAQTATVTGSSNLKGNVTVGTTAQAANLNVNGTLRSKDLFAEKIEVKANAWYDHVFNPEYELLTLPELEQYIKQNNRLPEIPSASEVQENGIDLGDMQAKLLLKIEELTLYILQQNQQLIELQNQINELKK